ncbi:MAG: hypothetical protein WCG87_06885 [Bacteroidota bacterium]
MKAHLSAKYLLLCISLGLLTISNASAQNVSDKLINTNTTVVEKINDLEETTYRPKAVLIQLNSYKNQIDHLTKRGYLIKTAEVKIDAAKVPEYTKRDFNDHFGYCPVYYFWDTCLNAIRNREFSNFLFDKDGKPAINIPITSKSRDYIIVTEGFDTKNDLDELTRLNSKGLLILNDKYEMIHVISRAEIIFSIKAMFFREYKRKYVYTSSKYDGIEYLPYAKQLNYYLYNTWNKKTPHPSKRTKAPKVY